MAGDADNWMPLFIGDYLADTGHLSATEHGAYLLLIMAYWRRGGPLPDDDAQLTRLSRTTPSEWKRARVNVSGLFNISNGLWRHGRIEREMEMATERKRKQRERTAAASRARHRNDPRNDDRNDLRNGERNDTAEPSVTTSSPSPSPSPREPSGSLESGAHSAPTTTKPASNGAHNGTDRARRGSRLPDDWRPDEQDRAFAESLGLDADSIAPGFRDYWHARAGGGGVKLDWPATWRNWCRKEAERRSVSPRHGPGSILAAARKVIAHGNH